MAAHADQYDDFAVISSTMGVQGGRVCVGEATRGDIGCPTYAPSVAADGSISATRFVGDGSGLFNIAGASADRIVSGTTSMLAISDTGYISVTQSGVNTAYFHPSLGLVTVGVSSTGGISGTTGHFSGNVGIGTTAPSATLHVSGTGRFSGDVTTNGSLIGYNFYLPGMNDFIGGSGVSTNHYLKFVTSNTEAMRIVSTGYVGIGTMTPKVSLDIGNNNFRLGGEGQYIGFNGYYNTSAGSWRNVDANTYVGAIRMGMSYANQGGDLQFYTQRDPTTNSTNDTNLSVYQRMVIRRSGDVRIGYGLHVGDTSFATTPTTALEVSGTVSATRFVGDGSGLFNIAGASADRIVSGTTSMLAISNTGYISVTQSGVNTAYFHPSMGLVTVGVSSTGAISGTRGYFNNSVPGADTLNVKAAANDVGIAVLNSSNSYVIARLGQEVNNQGRLMLFSAPSSVPGLSLIAGGNSYISNKLLIGGNGTGSTTLHVVGSALTTSWTGINFSNAGNVVPSAPLEVSGTVSATMLQIANTAPDSACASTSDLGKMRRNPTTGRMQVCR